MARQIGALVVLICDEERRPLQSIQTDDVPARPRADALPIYGMIAATIGDQPGLTGVLAMARPRRLGVTADHLAWRRLFAEASTGTPRCSGSTS